MARQQVVLDGRALTINFDDPRQRGRLFQSIVIRQLIDELTGDPVQSRPRIWTNLDGARTKSVSDGICGLVGIPTRVFPRLNSGPTPFEVRYEAPGYAEISESIEYLAQAGFPESFAAQPLQQLQARRRPVSISGRVVSPDGMNQPVPVANASIEINGVWRRVQDIDILAGPPVVPMLSVQPTLYANRPAGTTLEIVSLPPVVEPDRTLVAGVGQRSRDIQVSHTIGLAPGSVVGLDLATPERAEYVEVESVDGPSDPNSPATLRLKFELKFSHGYGGLVQAVTVPPAGAADANLTEVALRDDVVLFVDSTAAFSPNGLVRISGGTAHPEYQTAGTFQAQSDAEGYYRLPSLSRVAAIEVSASRAAPPPALTGSKAFSPNYSLHENRLDLTVS